jgi:hypothetical protein
MSGRQAKAKRARQAAAVAAVKHRLEGETFWHGGAPGLGVGEFLLTADDARAARRFDTAHNAQLGYLDGTTSTERVYFTTDREMARAFGWLYQVDGTPSGALYRVEPIGTIEPDPDYSRHDVSWCAPGARIVAVEEECVDLDEYGATERIGPYWTWKGGGSMYDVNGRFLPSPRMLALGITADWLAARFRPWTSPRTVSDTIEGMSGHGR